MKELVVIVGTIILGIGIFNMMVGTGVNGQPSLKDASEDVFRYAIHQFE